MFVIQTEAEMEALLTVIALVVIAAVPSFITYVVPYIV